MEIVLNEKPIDFKLEKERYLGEVIQGIEQWLSNEHMYITYLDVDGRKLFTVPREEWSEQDIGEIDRVTVACAPISEVRLSSLLNMQNYVGITYNALQTGNGKVLEELEEGYEYLLESIHIILKNSPSVLMKKAVEHFTLLFPDFNPKRLLTLNETAKTQTGKALEMLLESINLLILEEKNPLEALKYMAGRLKNSAEEISEVSILLQTGKDREAMNRLISFSVVLQEFVRIFLVHRTASNLDVKSLSIGGTSFEEFYQTLNSFLKELSGAFETGDSVLIGDLLEYEIAPRIEELVDLIDDFVEPPHETR